MISLEEMQAVGAFVTLLFGLFVVLTPNRNLISLKVQNRIYNKSRWLLVSGLVLLSVQFMLQRFMGFRSMGVSQAVAVNIIFIKPAVMLISLSILNLLTFGKLRTWHIRLAKGVVGIVYALLFVAALLGEGGLMGGSFVVRLIEVVSSALTSVCIVIFCVDSWLCYRRISVALDEYYDSPQQSVIRRFAVSVMVFVFIALLTPVTTYTTSRLVLLLHGFLSFVSIAFMVMSFLRYGAENSMMLLMPVANEAQGTEDEAEHRDPMACEQPDVISDKVTQWLAEGRHLRAGITAAEIASELSITRDELKLYVRGQRYPKIGSWLAYHRIEHAKTLLLTYDNYNYDSIAEMCGFSSREYFHKCFKDVVGVPPLYWQKTVAPNLNENVHAVGQNG